MGLQSYSTSIRFAIVLFNGKTLSFEHRLPNKTELADYAQKGVKKEATYFTILWPLPEK